LTSYAGQNALKVRIASTKLARHNFQALADQESLRFVDSVSSINCETSRDGGELFFEKSAEFWTSKIELISPSPLGEGGFGLNKWRGEDIATGLGFPSSWLENLKSAALFAITQPRPLLAPRRKPRRIRLRLRNQRFKPFNTFKPFKSLKALRAQKMVPILMLAPEIVEDLEAALEQFCEIAADLSSDGMEPGKS
jgi:hypothetical protein